MNKKQEDNIFLKEPHTKMYIDLTVIILIGFLVGFCLFMHYVIIPWCDRNDDTYYDELERTREDRIRRGACVPPFS